MSVSKPDASPRFLQDIRPSGEGMVWLTSMGLASGLVMVLGLLLVIFWNGISFFWPAPVYEVRLTEGAPPLPGGVRHFAAMVVEERAKPNADNAAEFSGREVKFFLGNKDVFNEMFVWVDEALIAERVLAENIMVAERLTGGDALFRPVALRTSSGEAVSADDTGFANRLQQEIEEARERQKRIDDLSSGPIDRLARRLKQIDIQQRLLSQRHPELRLRLREMEAIFADRRRLQGEADMTVLAELEARYAALAASNKVLGQLAELHQEQTGILDETEVYSSQVNELREANASWVLDYQLLSGEERSEAVGRILRAWNPAELGFFGKVGFFFSRLWAFLSESPRSANTEGGVFPAIFGTFVMTVLMSAAVMPFGVVAAIYLREYATQGNFTRAVRVAINNLAGVPSIVYGVFGLGFFVYFVGDGIDGIFFPDRHALNEPVFGTGGILWASLTLALMTIPVVVVATEEALAAVPRGMREASLACGASKWQTIQRVVLPASSSGILTGLVLAMARGAGEVAPLMVVGVIKFAPNLPVDGTYPFVHLDRKFMHLGFHIFDLGFQSPDAEAVKPLVFATTLLLIVLVVVMNLSAILIRDHLHRKYSGGNF